MNHGPGGATALGASLSCLTAIVNCNIHVRLQVITCYPTLRGSQQVRLVLRVSISVRINIQDQVADMH